MRIDLDYRSTILILLLLLSLQRANAQTDSVIAQNSESPFPRFGIQFDLSTLLFHNTIAMAGDVNFERVTMGGNPTYIGLRVGFQRIQASTFGGTVFGSPFFDSDFLVRLSTVGSSIKVDSYVGLSYRSSLSSNTYPASSQLKIGMDWAWIMIENSVDVFLRLALVRGSIHNLMLLYYILFL